MPLHKFKILIVVASLVTAAGCRTPYATQQQSLSQPAIERPRPLVLPSDSSDAVYSGLHDRDAVIHFYTKGDFKPVWFDSLGNQTAADSMMSIIRNVRYFGLMPAWYHLPEIEQIEYPHVILYSQRMEVLLTDAYLKLAGDLSDGVTRSNAGDTTQFDMLRKAIRSNELLKSLKSVEPQYSQYLALRGAIQSLLDSVDLEADESLLLGQSMGENQTEKILEAIEVNLERWRLENNLSEEGSYIYINVPSFMLSVVKDGNVVLESKIIVGAPKTPTPEISSNVECFVIYPYWHVPRKISVEEYLPILQRDTSFLTRNNFDVLDRKGKVLRPDSIDWKKYNRNHFPFSLRQREGNENSLGLIKFVFDNPYAVFVHDTNAKGLFKNKVRALSHGCVRVDKAFELGAYLLTGEPGKKSALLEKYIDREQRRTISLAKPVPIYIRYFTCAVIGDKLVLYNDCYQQDQQLATKMYK